MSKKRQRAEREQIQADAADVSSQRKHFRPDPKSNNLISLTPEQASRLLYPNPVCFLTSLSPDARQNVMTLSWLAPANNYGGFVFVIHKTRFSANCLIEKKEFMLSVATSDQIDVLLACGKVSGSTTDKLNGSIPGLAVASQQPATTAGNAFAALQDSSDDSDEEAEEATASAGGAIDGASLVHKVELAPISGTVAHMKCSVISSSDAADAGHWLIVAKITEAHVNSQYWDGKVFAPLFSELPGLLSFFGSQQFGVMRRISEAGSSAGIGATGVIESDDEQESAQR